MTRTTELLMKCAANLDNGCAAMHHEFLVENNITADECFMLGQQMAVAIRAYARAPADLRVKLVIMSEINDEGERAHMVAALEHSSAMKGALERLKKLSGNISGKP